MVRQIVNIDERKCSGCGLCVSACHEGAIGLVNGVAKLLRDDYCDGLGNCLPACPTGAITLEERDTLDYNESEVMKHMKKQEHESKHEHGHGDEHKHEREAPLACGCPGSNAKSIRHDESPAARPYPSAQVTSQLNQWPVQIKLIPVNAPYFENANLLVAADCTAYAYGNFHQEFMHGRITLIGCPKLDEVDYSEKLTAIITQNNIKSVTILRMEVPCCGGIENAVKTALKDSGKMIPWQVVTISTDGEILD